jgi:hypothetical protein
MALHTSPSQRTEDLVIEPMPGGEVLVYDLRTDQAHHLDADAALVWEHADRADVAALASLSTEQVRTTLAKLGELDLLTQPAMSRRDMVTRGAKIAVVTAAAAPVIRSITAPTPAHASSLTGTGGGCTSSVQCSSGLCLGGLCT